MCGPLLLCRSDIPTRVYLKWLNDKQVQERKPRCGERAAYGYPSTSLMSSTTLALSCLAMSTTTSACCLKSALYCVGYCGALPQAHGVHGALPQSCRVCPAVCCSFIILELDDTHLLIKEDCVDFVHREVKAFNNKNVYTPPVDAQQ